MQKTSKMLFGIVSIMASLVMVGEVMAQPGGGRRGAPDPADLIERFDTDKDGKLSKSELPERMQGMMDRVDGDKDGSITKEELTKMFANRGGGRGGERGGRGGGLGGGRGGRGGEFGGRGGPGGGSDMMMRMMKSMPIIAALDADGDGELSEKEIANAVVALKKLDKNEDGKLAGEEIMPKRPEFGRGGPGGREGRGGGEFGGRGGRGPGGDRGGRPQRPSRPE